MGVPIKYLEAMHPFIVVIAEVVPPSVLLAALLHDHRRRKLAGERSPQDDKLLRAPGHTLQEMLEQKRERFSEWFMLAMFGGNFFGMMVWLEPPGYFVLCWIGAVTAVVGSVIGWRTFQAIRPLRLGLMGERAVAEQLNILSASGYRIFHDVKGSGEWNIDHVAVGPAGVFAVETKTRTKKPGRNSKKDNNVSFDGKQLVFPAGIDTEASDQARRNAKWLATELCKSTGAPVSVRPILTLPGWWVTMTAYTEVIALNPKQIPGFVLREMRVLQDEMIQRIAHQLDQRCRDVDF